MHHLATLSALLVMPTHTGTEALGMILRWFHFLAGITWIGLLYFFNLINVPFMKQVDAGMKPKVFQYMTLPALQWFRWSALFTVIFGFWYWSQIYVAADAQRMGVSPWSTIGLFLLIWIVTWAILYAVIAKMKPSGYVLFAISTVVVIAAAWLFLNYTPVGQDDNHVLSIGVGGGFGLVMMLNVWGIIWRNNKKVIQGTLAGSPPADAAVLARQAFLASRTNFYLSVPMLFFMASSYHYVIFGK
ncbi:MAG: urate hydroxylase PuuD [Acidobacteriia bacterium]|nr:urate hydroxylase PuuD [Terriglobia bacterium]